MIVGWSEGWGPICRPAPYQCSRGLADVVGQLPVYQLVLAYVVFRKVGDVRELRWLQVRLGEILECQRLQLLVLLLPQGCDRLR